jgi:hypothetical protein
MQEKQEIKFPTAIDKKKLNIFVVLDKQYLP